MLVVIALGGNALLRRDEAPEAAAKEKNVRVAAAAVAEVARDHDVVVTHGNGPQIGLLALQAAAYHAVRPYPLDVLGAESEGMIGYVLEQQARQRPARPAAATLLTQVEVDPRDHAFAQPTKPIGPVYTGGRSRAHRPREGLDHGARRPRLAAPRRLAGAARDPRARRHPPSGQAAPAIVISAGGGGIPVAAGADGRLTGVEAVIDKDHVAALLAAELGADQLLLLTDVAAIYADWPAPARRAIRSAGPSHLRDLALPAGSMAPKAQAAASFAERSGRAAIGALGEAAAILRGAAGTTVERNIESVTYW